MSSNKGKLNVKNNSFVNRNLVAIVMIPAIIGIHYGWTLLQNNEALVKKEEHMDLPIVKSAKYLWKKIQNVAGFKD